MCGLFYRPQLAKKSHVELAENVVDQREGLKTWGGDKYGIHVRFFISPITKNLTEINWICKPDFGKVL